MSEDTTYLPTDASRPLLYAALCKAQAELGGARKDSKNPHFKSSYADLESVTDTIRPVAAKYGLAYIQRFHDFEGGVAVETIIIHESGAQISNGILRIPATKQDAQGYGSAITYARRYSLQTAFGVAPEDDDGNAASRPTLPPAKITAQQAADLQALADEVAADGPAFLKYLSGLAKVEIHTMADIPAGVIKQAIQALQAKRGAKK